MDEDIKIGGNEEIAEALKEFEAKSAVETQKKVVKAEASSDVPKIVRLVMKLSGGAIKEEKQAEYILLGIVILMLGLSLYFFFRGSSSVTPIPVPPLPLVQ